MGYVIWKGKGFDGKPVALYLAAVDRPSSNRKTGRMIQTMILRTKVRPSDAVVRGDDRATCGDCALRAGQGCYVQVGRSVHAAWATTSQEIVDIADVPLPPNPTIRVGSYGDPAVVPVSIWKKLLKLAVGWTGYTHAWRTASRAYAKLVMASVESTEDRLAAKAKGYRTFRVMPPGGQLEAGEILCPASAEAGHRTTCERCLLCNGSRGPDDKRKDIAVVAHGPTAKRVFSAREH